MKTKNQTQKKHRTEKWRGIPGWETYYQVSSIGRVRSLDRLIERPARTGPRRIKERIMKLRQDYRGYKVVDLSRHGKSIIMRVNRLVALAFLPNPSHLPEVNHRDAVKGNNSVGNLEWVSHEQNMNHAKQMQLMKPRRGEDSGNAKFTNLRATKARNRFIPGISDAAAEARRGGVATESFKRIIRGETFADLPFVALVVGDFALPLAIFPQRVRGLLQSALPSNVSQKNPVGIVTRTAGEVRASMLQFKHNRPLRR